MVRRVRNATIPTHPLEPRHLMLPFQFGSEVSSFFSQVISGCFESSINTPL